MGLRIFLACAFGATIGTLVAINANPKLWWIGLLAGAFSGYVVFDIRAILVAIPVALHKAMPEMESPALIRRALERWLVYLVTFSAGFSSVILLLVTAFAWLGQLDDASATTISAASPLRLGMAVAILCGGLNAIATLRMSFEMAAKDLAIRNELHIPNLREEEHATMLFYNPIALFVVLPVVFIWNEVLPFAWGFCAEVAQLCALAMRAFIARIPSFLRHLFILIHSELRLLCACDAAIGAAIGFSTGSVIMGALAGGVFGLLNYEIISKRVLKLVPVRA